MILQGLDDGGSSIVSLKLCDFQICSFRECDDTISHQKFKKLPFYGQQPREIQISLGCQNIWERADARFSPSAERRH